MKLGCNLNTSRKPTSAVWTQVRPLTGASFRSWLCTRLTGKNIITIRALRVSQRGSNSLFPRVPDQHKEGKPLVPNGLGVLYVLFTTVYLFTLYFLGVAKPVNGVSAPLTLAVCVFFVGFM